MESRGTRHSTLNKSGGTKTEAVAGVARDLNRKIASQRQEHCSSVMASSRPVTGRKFFGVFNRRERWGLSMRGFLGLVAAGVASFVTWLFGVYPFFAITDRVDTRLLSMEGWVDVYAVKAVADEFNAHGYERVFSTGGPVQGMGGYTNDYNTAASVGAGRLKTAGLPANVVQMVPSRMITRDRTYTSAVALRKWCEENKVPLTSINVVTADVHARRTRLLFQKALGSSVKVGIISVPHPDYDARRWWKYSQGVRSVMGECIAYAYARLIFVPTLDG